MSNNLGFDINKLMSSSTTVQIPDDKVQVIEEPKKKRGRPRKSEQQPKEEVVDQLPYCQSSQPYEDSYNETNNMLRGSIMQIDMLSNDVQAEIESIRKSKTIKGKYKYISDLCATASSLVATKISAIREMNASTTNSHKLEIQRIKDIRNAQSNQQDDDKFIADMYNAYINTPISNGQQNPMLAVNAGNTINNMPMMNNGVSLVSNDGQSEDQRFTEFMNNLTPEQNRMLLDGNPNIETVVVYDPNTGDKMFDVIDTSTGMPVPNYPRPDVGLLDDTMIDFGSGIASNSNIGQNWKVVEDAINHF